MLIYFHFFRNMVRQWKRHTEGYSDEELRSKFHQYDINGDGRLNHKEFKNLLINFGIKMSDSEQDILMNKFDNDEDGDIDMHEFFTFVENEKNNLYLDPQHESEELHRKIKKDHETKEEREKQNMIHPPKVGPRTVYLPQSRQGRDDHGLEFPDENRPMNPPPHRQEWNHSPAPRVRSHDPYLSYSQENVGSSSTRKGNDIERGRGRVRVRKENQDEEELRRRESERGSSERKYDSANHREDDKSRAIMRETWHDDSHSQGQEESQGRTYLPRDGLKTRQLVSSLPVHSRDRAQFEINNYQNQYQNPNQIDEFRNRNIETNAKKFNQDLKSNENSYEIRMRNGDMKSNNKEEFEFDDDTAITSVEANWATKMLQAQSHIETRLGKRYY